MVRIYTLTLAPSLDSATITPQIYPEGKLRCTSPVFEPGGGGINVARAIAHLGGTATAIFPAGGATGEHLVALLRASYLERANVLGWDDALTVAREALILAHLPVEDHLEGLA